MVTKVGDCRIWAAKDHSEEQIVIPYVNHKTGDAGSAKLVVHKDDMGYLLDYYF